ncbi:lysophospholipid acyltransferase family protein [Maritimibacter dapengensis]|uniref:Lysophospholipid acyltransferase family protein n=1 Tax=Maritimibacter dapengensis TaxID=2836868 RepID=A0ABS6T218_9RHOB|nr:lysophospholipid acyltransferase family protein [Maritimibacter dapengensis]MBV7379284.1 lysophospholipid acyltransferase family protein [Maritimibacter dapengensis]
MPGVAHDISYAHTIEGRMLRALVRGLENSTGRRRLILRARGYEKDLATGADFWSVMAARFGIEAKIGGAGIDALRREGPLVVVANHPYGILDGLMMGHLLREARGAKFRILAHEVFSRAPELREVILPIDFAGTPEATRRNIETRRNAQAFLADGGAVGVFPGGTVSTAPTPFGRPMDPAWRLFTAKMVARSGAHVVPVFFEGQNSRLFQLASHVAVPIRMGLLIREFRARVDGPVGTIIGAPIAPETLAQFRASPKSMMDFLRERTYALSPTPVDWRATGFEFEERHKA